MLCLWLPFTDGTTKNQGLIQDGITIDVTPTFINEGKLGKCLNKGQIDISTDTTAKILNNQELTISFWLYVNAKEGSTTNSVSLFGNDGMSVNNNRKFSLFQYPTCNDLHLSWMNDAASTAFLSTTCQGVLPSYKWTHVAITYNNPNATIYINGQIYAKKTGISNSSSFKYKTRVVWNNAYRYLNDFRIYNTCLSPRQIKEISKGLICHYPLGEVDGKIGGRNLIINNNTVDGWVNSHGSIVSSTAYKATDYIPVDPGDTITFQLWTPSSVQSWIDDTYFDSDKNYVTGYNGVYITSNYIIKTYTVPEGAAYVRMSYSWATGYKVKLESGNKATPWTPAPEDDTSFYDNVIYDTSGYCNNGSVTDSTCPTWSSDTPRYKGSYYFDKNKYIRINDFQYENIKHGTINIWINRHSTSSSWRTYLFLANAFNWTGNEHDFIILGSTGGQDVTIDCCSHAYPYSVELNKWYMFTITWDLESHISNYYVNGQKIKTYNDDRINITYASKHNSHCLGSITATYEQDYSLSDFRIYATALSDSDILELYQSSASVDNNGNLMLAGEVIEE